LNQRHGHPININGSREHGSDRQRQERHIPKLFCIDYFKYLISGIMNGIVMLFLFMFGE
jgi:hypothetical protein